VIGIGILNCVCDRGISFKIL